MCCMMNCRKGSWVRSIPGMLDRHRIIYNPYLIESVDPSLLLVPVQVDYVHICTFSPIIPREDGRLIVDEAAELVGYSMLQFTKFSVSNCA